ncbi:ribonuclease T2 [Roseobacter sp. HKCCA0434]|uniref:ribonuclease T2 n=1 Tax=Roseobacter sp. HKCCA0434 TaxID=3079297 RepID=UPI002905CE06|nr:ribonuclease T2 [Roseobacter sp. HKCCA0434]
MRWLIGAMLWAGAAMAQDRAGEFDYYVLALSWSPTWCAGEGQGAEQCERELGFVLHGLWPQYEYGWPDYCRTEARDPSRRETGAMADIMGSDGSAWHQWQKHGRCSGLSSEGYFALAREAFERIERPAILRQVEEAVRLSPSVVEEAFLEANPELEPDGVTITCRDRRIQEARICLTRELEPRLCGRDVRRDCTGTAELLPIR